MIKGLVSDILLSRSLQVPAESVSIELASVIRIEVQPKKRVLQKQAKSDRTHLRKQAQLWVVGIGDNGQAINILQQENERVCA